MEQDKSGNSSAKFVRVLNRMAETKIADHIVAGINPRVYWPLLVASLVPISVCVVLWVIMLVTTDRDLGRLFYVLCLAVPTVIASVVGAIIAIIGLSYVSFAEKRFGRAFGSSLALNIAVVAVPVLWVFASHWYEERISLVRAVESGSVRRLEYVLSWRTAPPHPDEAHRSLNAAVRAGKIEMIDLLVGEFWKKWPNALPFDNVTYEYALMLAVADNNPELARVLLTGRANPNKPYLVHAKLPLQLAVEERNAEIVRLLLDHGADPNQRWSRFSGDNQPSVLETAEIVARRTNNQEIVDLLRSHGAK